MISTSAERVKKFKAANPERYAEIQRKWKVKATTAGYFRSWSAQLREQVLDKYGRVCMSCGFDDFRALHIDHVFNDGYIERKGTTASQRYRKMLDDTEGRYQVLCANCNFIKKYENSKRRGEVQVGGR
jgi:hypothetical protein